MREREKERERERERERGREFVSGSQEPCISGGVFGTLPNICDAVFSRK